MLASKLNTQPSIDFFSELSKIVNNKHESPNTNAQTILSESSEPSNLIIYTPTANDSTEINYCLISKEKLHPNHITLTCNHKFNYIPLYKEVIYQKNKTNTLYEITKLSSNQIKCPYCRTITNNLLPYIPYPSVKIIKNVNSPEYECMDATKCSHIMKKCDANKITTTCKKNALYYEEENVLLCPAHYKKYKEKSGSKEKHSTNTPRCSAVLKSGKNIGNPCNSIISMDGSIFCKRHSQ
jgi:hypothetical protein